MSSTPHQELPSGGEKVYFVGDVELQVFKTGQKFTPPSMHRDRKLTKKGKALGNQSYSNLVGAAPTKGMAFTGVLPYFVTTKVPLERGEKVRQRVIDGLRNEGKLPPARDEHDDASNSNSPAAATAVAYGASSPSALDDLASVAGVVTVPVVTKVFTRAELLETDITAALPEARNKLLEQLNKDRTDMPPPPPRKPSASKRAESSSTDGTPAKRQRKPRSSTTGTSGKSPRRKTTTSQTTTVTEEGDRRTYSNTITVNEEEFAEDGGGAASAADEVMASGEAASLTGDPSSRRELDSWLEAAERVLHAPDNTSAPPSPARGFDGSAIDALQFAPLSPSSSVYARQWMSPSGGVATGLSPRNVNPHSIPPLPPSGGLSPRSSSVAYPSFSQNPYQPPTSGALTPSMAVQVLRSPLTVASSPVPRGLPPQQQQQQQQHSISDYLLFSPSRSPAHGALAPAPATATAAATTAGDLTPSRWVDHFPMASPDPYSSGNLTPSLVPPPSPLDVAAFNAAGGRLPAHASANPHNTTDVLIRAFLNELDSA